MGIKQGICLPLETSGFTPDRTISQTASVREAGSDACCTPWSHRTATTALFSHGKGVVSFPHGTPGSEATCSLLTLRSLFAGDLEAFRLIAKRNQGAASSAEADGSGKAG